MLEQQDVDGEQKTRGDRNPIPKGESVGGIQFIIFVFNISYVHSMQPFVRFMYRMQELFHIKYTQYPYILLQYNFSFEDKSRTQDKLVQVD